MVSHDIAEILRLADRAIRLENGRVTADGDPAGVVLSITATEGVSLYGHHVSGPDEHGVSVVSVDGRLCRIRYRDATASPAAGTPVMLDIDEATVRDAALPLPADHAGPMRTFTSRGGA